MSGRETMKLELRDAFVKRGVRRVVYFHCDHWEPWKQAAPGDALLSDTNADDLCYFVDRMGEIDFARNLTLFYKCPIGYAFDAQRTRSPGQKVDEKDQIRLLDRTPQHMEIARGAMQYLLAHSTHDIQVHVHHENITYNTQHKRAEAVEYFKAPESRIYEEARLDFFIKTILGYIAAEIGRPLHNWLHVHGHWGLNASDPTVCHVTREIEMLMANGCVGDFTVPSGRSGVNPRLEVPYFVNPVDAPKGYDLPAGEPEYAYGNRAAAHHKFFMWSSRIKHRGSSLDYYSDRVTSRFEQPTGVGLEFIKDSFFVDGTLFVKTHAHSMHPSYYADDSRPVHPLEFPPIHDFFSLFFDAAADAGAELSFLHASQVYDLFRNADYKPPEGFALVAPGQPPVVAGIVPPPPMLDMKTGLQLDAPDVDAIKSSAPPQSAAGAAITVATDLINEVATKTLREAIETLGVEESGAGAFYARRVASGQTIAPYELELVRHLVEWDDRFDAYYEIGCGAAVLSMALAANGLPAVGVDSNRKRAELGEAILAELSTRTKLAAPCRIITGKFPNIDQTGFGNSIALVTNLTATVSDEERAEFIRGLCAFKAVIIGVAHFIRLAKTADEQAALVSELESFGLKSPRLIFGLGASIPYYRFDTRD